MPRLIINALVTSGCLFLLAACATVPSADSAAAEPAASLSWTVSTANHPSFVAFWTYVAILDGRISRDSDVAQVFWIQQRDTAAPVMVQRTNQLGGCVPGSANSQSVPPPPAVPAPLPAITESAIRSVAEPNTTEPQAGGTTKVIASDLSGFVQGQFVMSSSSTTFTSQSVAQHGC